MSLQDSHQISDVKVMLVKGADGNGIVDISLTGQSGLVDTYTITLSNDDKYTFDVTNGNGIDRIEKTATHGLVDTYTIYFDNGDTETFDVTNGMGGGMSARLLINSDAGSTVTVTTPSGTVLTAEQVTGSTTQWYCDTVEYGVHTIDAVLGGVDAQVTVTVDSCKVYNIDDTHLHATINVKYPYGATCRCQGGSESYYADGSPYTFSVHSANTYTITVVYDGQTYTDTVTVTTSGSSFNEVVPSPSTAPVNDINIWLSMGEVSGTYSSLSDILADSSALATLMASQDAVDYLVRCTSWVSDITGNQSAMSYIGLNNYCANTLLDDSTWCEAIANSTYFESVLNVKIPTMTSNTTPSGVAFSSSNSYNNIYPWMAFDNSDSTRWWPASLEQGSYVGYQFTSNHKFYKALVIVDKYAVNTVGAKNYKLQQSTDGTNYTDLSTFTTSPHTGTTLATETFTRVFETDSVQYLRLICTDVMFEDIPSNSKINYIATLQFYGREDV